MLPTAEPLTGDPFHVSGYAFNRGMRSIALTLSLEEGRGAFHRIAATRDIVMEAMRRGVAAKLGVVYEKATAA
jgi:crotonobetainyl-CoA:carnitine CoA-transferase CaiB-like acyl-CoA transferase